MRRLSRFVLLATLVAVVTVGATARLREADPTVPREPGTQAEADPVIELASVEVERVRRQDLASDVRVSGSLEPSRRTALNAKVSGTVEAVVKDVGDAVEAGEVVLRFETATLQSVLDARVATLEASQAQLRLAESTLDRSQRLGQAGFASQAARLEAEAGVLNIRAQVRALEAEVNDARRALDDAAVRAPFAGIIAERSVQPGQTVPLNAELMSVVDLSDMEIDAGVPTSRIAALSVGQAATFAVEGFPDRSFPATVRRISPTAVAGSRAVRVFLKVANDDGLLRGGMFATGRVTVRAYPDVIALPSSAIRRDDGGTFVLKTLNDRVVRQDVGTGRNWPDRGLVEIASGLREGDVVVTAPLPDLKPDTAVRLAEL